MYNQINKEKTIATPILNFKIAEEFSSGPSNSEPSIPSTGKSSPFKLSFSAESTSYTESNPSASTTYPPVYCKNLLKVLSSEKVESSSSISFKQPSSFKGLVDPLHDLEPKEASPATI